MMGAVRALPVQIDQERVFTVLARLRESSAAATANPLYFSELQENILQLERLIFDLDREEHEAGCSTSAITALEDLSPEERAWLNEIYGSWETRLWPSGRLFARGRKNLPGTLPVPDNRRA